MTTHYKDPIDQTLGRLAGNSRNGGDASPEVIAQVQQIIINEARNANLTDHEIAYVLAIAENGITGVRVKLNYRYIPCHHSFGSKKAP